MRIVYVLVAVLLSAACTEPVPDCGKGEHPEYICHDMPGGESHCDWLCMPDKQP